MICAIPFNAISAIPEVHGTIDFRTRWWLMRKLALQTQRAELFDSLKNQTQ